MPHRLQVLAGTSLDPRDWTPVRVNDEVNATELQSPYFNGRLVVRIDGYRGDGASAGPERPAYFDAAGSKVTLSIHVQGQFVGDKQHEHRETWTADDILFGNVFDRPLRLPLGTNLAVAFMKRFVDESLECDLHCEKPWAHSPLLATMNTVSVSKSPDGKLAPWPGYNGSRLQEDCALLQITDGDETSKATTTAFETAKSRRSFLSKAHNRRMVTFSSADTIEMDFCTGFIDFNTFSVSLPVISVNLLKYWDHQPVKYVCDTRDGATTFFVVVLQLIEE